MVPVLLGSRRKFFPSLDQEHAGVTDLPTAHLSQPAATAEEHSYITQHTCAPNEPESEFRSVHNLQAYPTVLLMCVSLRYLLKHFCFKHLV